MELQPAPGACFALTEFNIQANYIIRLFDLVHFSSSYFIIFDLAVQMHKLKLGEKTFFSNVVGEQTEILDIQLGFMDDSCVLTVFWDWIQHMTGHNQSKSHHYSLKSIKNLQQLIFQRVLQVGGCHAVTFLQSLPHLDRMGKTHLMGFPQLFIVLKWFSKLSVW